MKRTWIVIAALLLILPLYGGGFERNDPKKIEVLRHFDIPASFLVDPYLHDIYTEKRREWMLGGFAVSSENAAVFVPILSSLIAQSDLPSEFLFVALAESHLEAGTTSSRGAAGIWQFMEDTGKLHGLHIDQYVDERRDHVKSTRAAIAYLSALKQEFGKWYLALMAYNCGEGKLKKAIRKAGSDDLRTLADPKRSYLPAQTIRYVRKVVALALLSTEEVFLAQFQSDAFSQNDHESPLATVYLPEGEHIDRIAAVLEMPRQKLITLNTHLKKGVVPPSQQAYPVYIPKNKLEEFREKFRTRELKGYLLMHRVKSGETIATLSKRYNVPKAAIMQENMLYDENAVLTQHSIRIPINKPYLKPARIHTAASGETLASVAQLYNMTIKQIRSINPFASETLKEGEEVNIAE